MTLPQEQAAAEVERQTPARRGPRVGDLESAFSAVKRERADCSRIRRSGDLIHRSRIAELALKHRLPTMYRFREAVEVGRPHGLWRRAGHLFRRAATYVDKILKGAKPADLPVEQPTKFELVINLKTAKALGLTIPPSLLQRADQVIE